MTMGNRETADLERELSGCADLQQYLDRNTTRSDDQRVARSLAELMEQRGISRSALITGCGLNDIYVHQILSGYRRPSRDKLLCLALGLGLSAEQAAELQATLQLQNAVGSSGGSSGGASVSGGVDLSKMTDAQIYQYLFDSNYTNQNEAAIKAHLQSQGMSSTLAGAIAGAFADTEYFKLKNIADANRVYGESNLLTVPEFGKISYEEAEQLEMEGYLMLVGIGKDGKPEYARTNKAYMPDYQVKKG